MKHKLTLLAALLTCLSAAQAQTFTVANADGVDITYAVTSGNAVGVAAGSYSGSVVVPAAVTNGSKTYTVTSVQSEAFYGSQVRFVHLPAGVTSLGYHAFFSCLQLDSVRLDAPVVVALDSNQAQRVFGTISAVLRQPEIIVACGTLASYRATDWNRFRTLRSPCSHLLTVSPTWDSIIAPHLEGFPRDTSRGWYETGDTAWAVAERFSVRNEYGGYTVPRYGYFLGWSDGGLELRHPFVMVDHDYTLLALVDTLAHAPITSGGISTSAYLFGNLSYDGSLCHYAVNSLETVDEGQGPNTVFATSLWVGNREHLAGGRFYVSGNDFVAGPLRVGRGTTSVFGARNYARVWHITREMLDYHVAHHSDPDYTVPNAIATWPVHPVANSGYAATLAPFHDADGDGRYNPQSGDYPLIRGDECVFSIFNDGHVEHGETHGLPLGVEIHAMTYAFHEPANTALSNTIFVHYDLFNRSPNSYDSVYLGAWVDFDIGNPTDDYIGCDVANGMFYGYNGTDSDFVFLNGLPAQGCMILGGALIPPDGLDNPAIVDFPGSFTPGDTYGNMGINGAGFGDGVADNERMGMTSFVYYDNSYNSLNGEPSATSDYYNYMVGNTKLGRQFTFGGNGLYGNTPYRFMYPGDSDPWWWGSDGQEPSDVQAGGWTEASAGIAPGDRRGVAGSGPFRFEAGSQQQFDLAYVTGIGPDAASSVEALRLLAREVRRQWQTGISDGGTPFLYEPHNVGIAPAPTGAVRLEVGPNPTSGLLRVTVSEPADLRLYDMMGRCLLSARAAVGTSQLDLGALPAGVYLLRAGGSAQRVVKR